MKPWEILSTRVLLDRRWLRLHEQRVALPNGTVIEEYHVVDSPDWVAVLALTAGHEIVMVDQYRHGYGRVSRELPAGVIDPGETPIQAANRELLEETGYTVDELVPLFALSPEPHRSIHRGHFFFGKNARLTAAARPEPSEVLEVHVRPIAEVVADALAGRIAHAAHTAAILAAHGRGYLA
jgi:8-oxo-dGTP pyrophosphatase MutT (NUDIX family)